MAVSLGLYGAVAAAAFFPCLFRGQAYFDNDLLAQFGPWRAFLRNQLALGHFPLWDPYLLGGQPFFADPQNMLLYPLNWLTLPFYLPMGLSLFFFLHMVLAALGMHLWLKSLGLSQTACRLGALLFSLSGFFWLEIIHPPVLAAFAWLPWFFSRLERLAREPKPLNAFLAGFCFALLFLCGSFQVTVGALYGGAAYFLFRYFQVNRILSLPDFRAFSLLALFFLWGAFPLLGQFIPTLEFARLSDRYTPGAQTEKMNSKYSLSPATLGQFLFPRMALEEDGDMAVALQPGKDKSDFPMAADWGYLGAWVPFFLWGAWRGGKKALPAFLSACAGLALLFCLGRFTPLHAFVSAVLPGFSLVRVPFRFLYLYVLAASALVSLGWDSFFSGGSGPALGWKSPLAYAFALCLFSLGRPVQNWREILAVGIGLGGFGLYLFSRSKPLGKALVLTSLVLPLWLNGWADFVPGPASNFDFAGKSQAILQAADSVKPARLVFLNEEMYYPIEVGGKKYLVNYPQNAACALGIRNLGGYDPLKLQAKMDVGNLPFPVVAQLGAVGGLLTQTNYGAIPGFKLESFPPYLFYRRLESAALALGPDSIQCGLERDGTDDQVFSVDLPQAGQVAFTETMYPGWKAWVDGQAAPLSTADHILRALDLTAGRHEVEFKFEPVWWTPIRAGLALWCLATLLGLLAALRRGFFFLLQKIYYSVGGHGLGRIKVLRWAYGLLFRFFKPRSVVVQGHRMWLDDKDTLELAVHEVYEPMETALLREHLKENQTFVDVGANIGYYTLLAARAVGPKGRVYAFEPDPANFRLLEKNVALNGYHRNVVMVNKALSSESGTAKLYLNPVNRGDHRIYNTRDGRESVDIETLALDEYLKKLDQKVHFIKMDVQGAEAAALGGMKGLIRKSGGLKLVTEFSPGALKAFGTDPRKYLRDLQALGFRLLEISEKQKTVQPVTPARLMRRKWGGSEDYTNLFCVRKK